MKGPGERIVTEFNGGINMLHGCNIGKQLLAVARSFLCLNYMGVFYGNTSDSAW